jgi:hypothetical protein
MEKWLLSPVQSLEFVRGRFMVLPRSDHENTQSSSDSVPENKKARVNLRRDSWEPMGLIPLNQTHMLHFEIAHLLLCTKFPRQINVTVDGA